VGCVVAQALSNTMQNAVNVSIAILFEILLNFFI